MKRPLRTMLNSKSLSIIGIPNKFHKLKKEDYDNFNNKYLEEVIGYVKSYILNISARFKTCEGVFFYGANGTGKTMLSSLILKEAYRNRYSVRRLTFADYVSLYTDVWNTYNDEKEDLKNKASIYKSAEFLVLEEIGKEIDSSISVPILEELLRYREDKGLVTIICTNLTPDLIVENYGASIMSLTKGNMTPIKMETNDYRMKSFKGRLINEKAKKGKAFS